MLRLALRLLVVMVVLGAHLLPSPAGPGAPHAAAAMPVQPALVPVPRAALPDAPEPLRAAYAEGQIVRVTITLALRHLARLEQRVLAASDPSSPHFRHFLSDAAFLQTYAPSRAGYARYRAYLAGSGLAVRAHDRFHLILQASGTRGQFAAAFHTTIGTLTAVLGAGGTTPAAALRLPASLAAETARISRFAGVSENHSFLVHAPAPRGGGSPAPFTGYAPATLRAAYAVPRTLDGTGQTVAIVLWRPPVQQDLGSPPAGPPPIAATSCDFSQTPATPVGSGPPGTSVLINPDFADGGYWQAVYWTNHDVCTTDTPMCSDYIAHFPQSCPIPANAVPGAGLIRVETNNHNAGYYLAFTVTGASDATPPPPPTATSTPVPLAPLAAVPSPGVPAVTWNQAFPAFAFQGPITALAASGPSQTPGPCPPDVTICTIGQAQAGLDPHDDAEATVDAAEVHAVAPHAHILFSLAPSASDGDLEAALANAISYRDRAGRHVAAISASWGASCDTGGNPAHGPYDTLFLTAAALGIPVVVATGDSGIFCGSTANAAPVPGPAGYAAAPANSPWVLAVGATSLRITPATRAWRGERAWSCNPRALATCTAATGGASGGGLSAYRDGGQPRWQHGVIPAPPRTFAPVLRRTYTQRRAVPDISTNGDPASGLTYVNGGTLTAAGGTSAAAPWMAGALALATQAAGRPLGFVTPFFYRACRTAAWCHDVTQGFNGASARPGWDYTSGLGSIRDYSRFIAALAGTRPGTIAPPAAPATAPVRPAPAAAMSPTAVAATPSAATAPPPLITYYVDAARSGTTCTTLARACRTIQQAITLAGDRPATLCLVNPALPAHCTGSGTPTTTQAWYVEDVVIGTGQTITLVGDPGVRLAGSTRQPRASTLTVQRGAVATLDLAAVFGAPLRTHIDAAVLSNSGTLTIEGGTIEALPDYGPGVDLANQGTLLSTGSVFTTANGGLPGGGIRNLPGGIATIRDGRIRNNAAPGDGGGVVNLGTMTITGSRISSNTATGDGGGILNRGTLTLTDSSVSSNSAGDGTGGGIANQGQLTLRHTVISGNSAAGPGGGIANAGTLQSTASTITANATAALGGGLWNEPAGTATFTTATISDNDADRGGAGVENGGRLTVLDAAITSNTTNGGSGGGILDTGGAALLLANSTLAENVVVSPDGAGGGLALAPHATGTLLNDTLSGNSALNGVGGGLDLAGSSDLTLTNTILSANAARAAADCAGGPTTGGYNLLSPGGGCTVARTDVFTARASATGSSTRATSDFLRFHGGPTQTLRIAVHGTDPPAIGQGDPRVCRAAPIDGRDQRGFPRPTTTCDIGAYDTFADARIPTTFYVDQAHGRDSGVPCRSPGVGACATLGAALDFAGSSGTIVVAPGVYAVHLVIGASRTISFVGSGPGVILDGQGRGDTSVLRVDPFAAVDLTGLVIRGGHAFAGGGISNGGLLTVRNTQVVGNVADEQGGGVANAGPATLVLSRSTIGRNGALVGGGIFNGGGSVSIRDASLITGNTMGLTGSGAGIDTQFGVLSITDSAVTDNGSIPGAACGCQGGGIAALAGTVTINRSTISGNHTDSAGGGIYAVSSRITLANSTIAQNSVSGSGGSGAGLYLSDVLNVNPQATLFGVGLTLLNSTVTANHAASGTAGLFLSVHSLQATWQNTIVLGNVGGADCLFAATALPAGTHNLFSPGGGCATTTNGANVVTSTQTAGLDPLGNYGGPTQTVRLRAGSPAIGAGDVRTCALPPVNAVDQRGRARAARRCAIGAYEATADPPPGGS